MLTVGIANHAMALQKSMVFMQCGGAAQGGAACERGDKAREKEKEKEVEDAHRTCRASRQVRLRRRLIRLENRSKDCQGELGWEKEGRGGGVNAVSQLLRRGRRLCASRPRGQISA